MHVPTSWAGATRGEERAVLPQWSLPGAQPRGSASEQSQRRAVVIFLCAPMPERVLDDKAVKLLPLCLLFFFSPSSFQTNT